MGRRPPPSQISGSSQWARNGSGRRGSSSSRRPPPASQTRMKDFQKQVAATKAKKAAKAKAAQLAASKKPNNYTANAGVFQDNKGNYTINGISVPKSSNLLTSGAGQARHSELGKARTIDQMDTTGMQQAANNSMWGQLSQSQNANMGAMQRQGGASPSNMLLAGNKANAQTANALGGQGQRLAGMEAGAFNQANSFNDGAINTRQAHNSNMYNNTERANIQNRVKAMDFDNASKGRMWDALGKGAAGADALLTGSYDKKQKQSFIDRFGADTVNSVTDFVGDPLGTTSRGLGRTVSNIGKQIKSWF